MARHPRTSQFWDDGLRLISCCPLCETQYNPLDSQLIDEQGGSHLFHVTCKKCSHSILALIVFSPAGISSVGLITDLSYRDYMKLRRGEEVSSDDVLEIHELLTKEGEFVKTVSL
ncbi:hypothetical protein HY628_02020 [Candidatus Uhrbacteria bacterium]|nr:hypothetical protein [Candidatus Uhrbacteria bacterium]